jgi:hypothetical protein
MIRRKAEQAMLDWYKDLVPAEKAEQLTIKLVKEYIPEVDYYTKEVEAYYKGKVYPQRILYLASYTQRWFYKQEKKKYVTGYIEHTNT